MIKQTSNNHQANIDKTSSKRRAIRAHVVHVYFEYICLMFARSCQRGIKNSQKTVAHSYGDVILLTD